jgi:hypothetical protein
MLADFQTDAAAEMIDPSEDPTLRADGGDMPVGSGAGCNREPDEEAPPPKK